MFGGYGPDIFGIPVVTVGVPLSKTSKNSEKSIPERGRSEGG